MSAETKTIVVTGAASGIGLETAIGLARQGHRVIVHGRDEQRAEKARAQVVAAAGNDDVHAAVGDLSVRSDVERLATELSERYPSIDVLINNAGVLAPESATAKDGVDLNLAVNVVAPFVLTAGLTSVLRRQRPSRVINVTGGRSGAPFDVGELDGEKSFVRLNAYDASKRAMEAAALAQASDLAEHGVYLTIVHPGMASTSMTKSVSVSDMPWFMKPFWPLFALMMRRDDGGKSVRKAARVSIWAATAPETVQTAGGFYNKIKNGAGVSADLDPSVHDPANQRDVLDKIGPLPDGTS